MIAYRGIASREGKQRRATTPWSRWAGMKRRSPKGFLVSRSRIERNFRVPITLIGIGEKAEQPAGCLAVRLVGWLVGWLAGWLAGWLVGWLDGAKSSSKQIGGAALRVFEY